MIEDTLNVIQADIKWRIKSDVWLADVLCHDENDGDLTAARQAALGLVHGDTTAGLKGACIQVMPLRATISQVASVNAPMDVMAEIRVFQHRRNWNAAGGVNKTALAIARRIARIFHVSCSTGVVRNYRCDKPTIVGLSVRDEPETVAYAVNIAAAEARDESVVRVANPTQTTSEGLMTLACATTGATIYYTTNAATLIDSSYPWSGNANAVQYTTPFAVSAGTVVRACAYKAGCIASDVTWWNVS